MLPRAGPQFTAARCYQSFRGIANHLGRQFYILPSFRSASLNSSILGCKLLRDGKDVLGNQEGSQKEVFWERPVVRTQGS